MLFDFLRQRRFAVPQDALERQRSYLVLAASRVFLAVASLVAIYLDPTEPARYAPVAYGLLVFFVGHSIAALFYVQLHPNVGTGYALTMHVVDILWAAAVSLFTTGPNSPFFLLFFFTLLSAAFRWGFLASLATALTAIGVLAVEALVLSSSRHAHLLEGEFDLNRLIIRASYLLLMGVLIGYAAQDEKQLRAENLFISRLTERVASVERSLSATVLTVMTEIARLFDVPRVFIAVRDGNSGQLYLWTLSRPREPQPELRFAELDPDAAADFLFPAAGAAWLATRPPGDTAAPWPVVLLDANGHLRRQPYALPVPAPLGEQAQSLLAVDFSFGESWSGRLLLPDPRLQATPVRELRFVRKLFQQLGAAVYNLYLVRRLRSRAGAIERARAARELHDGAIQSLISAEMQVDVLRRKCAGTAPPMAGELGRIQEILRQEVISLRDLMQQIRPVDIGPNDLVEFIADTVDRFRRDTGIDARFVAELEDVPFPSRVCRELARMTQEALVNVRRHAAATRVTVRVARGETGWQLVIEDNGRGFPAAAAPMNGGGLQSPPAILRERAQLIGASLQVYSKAGEGTRIEITVPRAARATYAG